MLRRQARAGRAGRLIPTWNPRSSHIEALAGALAAFGRGARRDIDEMDGLNDAVSADILTQIVRSIDQSLWFVEAHLPPQPATPPAGEEPELAFEPDIPPEPSPATQDA